MYDDHYSTTVCILHGVLKWNRNKFSRLLPYIVACPDTLHFIPHTSSNTVQNPVLLAIRWNFWFTLCLVVASLHMSCAEYYVIAAYIVNTMVTWKVPGFEWERFVIVNRFKCVNATFERLTGALNARRTTWRGAWSTDEDERTKWIHWATRGIPWWHRKRLLPAC